MCQRFGVCCVHTYVQTHGAGWGRRRKVLPERGVTLCVIFQSKPCSYWLYSMVIHILIQCQDCFLANPDIDCQILIKPYLQGTARRWSIKMPEALRCQVCVCVCVWLWYNTENNSSRAIVGYLISAILQHHLPNNPPQVPECDFFFFSCVWVFFFLVFFIIIIFYLVTPKLWFISLELKMKGEYNILYLVTMIWTGTSRQIICSCN